jgi:type I restriction-modification system DNA methylase subunit
MASGIWSVADLLRGDSKCHEYGKVILPFTVLRRLDAVMAPTREAVPPPRGAPTRSSLLPPVTSPWRSWAQMNRTTEAGGA